MKTTSVWAVLGVIAVVMAGSAQAQQLSLQQDDEGVAVHVDGQLFTKYLVRSGAKPVLWPILGPTGKEMTRAYPMRPNTDEKNDHIHQRSFWFTHGDVNGISFWHEQDAHGTIVHREFKELKAEGGKAVIVTANDWVGPDGQLCCHDERRLTFWVAPGQRFIDFDIVLQAPDDRPVTFGDTKEGCFGLRVADWMRVELRRGGRIVTSEGLENEAAWGKRAAWVDYTGRLDGQTLGIAILNHPSSFRFPTYWHVRTYGLFAANPFGLRDFLGDKNVDGTVVLSPRQTLSLRYRVVFHTGDTESAGIAELFKKYAAEP
ncbi:MAG: hypothetical protein KatS3mg110_2747 [Pirellulaceae bacterium]|nr:MAG: hypothetical protein KatS3mg110_2747 [Pirellulaceae bacterium]